MKIIHGAWRLIAVGLLLAGGIAVAQEFPAKPIRFVVPYAPGGANDTVARLLGQKLSEQISQPVVIDNKPGASGMIAGEFVAKSPPDGYTIMVDLSSMTINPALHPNIPFDVRKDLTPIMRAVDIQHVIVVNPKVPATNIAELVALAKKQPGKLNYSSPGTGTPQHIAMELFKRSAGVDIVHIPYKGGAPAMMALVGGDEAQVSLLAGSTGFPQINAGKLRALAVFGERRLTALPDVPTMTEQGFKGFTSPWLGVFAPGRTPPATVARLHAEFTKALNTPAIRERLEKQGFDIVASSSETFARMIEDEYTVFGKLIRETGIKAE
jgi:tripartite-type tricarboxylate transporter receptor subunit TctC